MWGLGGEKGKEMDSRNWYSEVTCKKEYLKWGHWDVQGVPNFNFYIYYIDYLEMMEKGWRSCWLLYMCNVCFYIYKNIYISIQRTKKMNLYQETFNIYRKETGRILNIVNWGLPGGQRVNSRLFCQCRNKYGKCPPKTAWNLVKSVSPVWGCRYWYQHGAV